MKFDKNMEKLILGNLTQRKIGYGIVQPGNNIYSGVHVIKVYNIMAGLTKLSDLDLTATEIEEKYSRTRLKGGELIVSIVGTIGKTAIVPKEFAGCNIVRAIALIDIKEEFLSLWTKYYIDSPKGQEYIKGNLNTTVQPTLNIKSLSNMPIPFYGTVYTKKAVNILSTIDNKIQLNKQINENLEQQAQALFKSWFVDFEPFKDGKFVDSELGRIPEGWRVGVFNELVEILSGFAFKSNTFVEKGKYQLITIKAVQDGLLNISGSNYINIIPPKMPQYCFLRKGDILLSLTGNVGRTCIVTYDNLLLNQRVAKIKPKNIINRMFLYIILRQLDFKKRLIYLAKGTAQLNLSPIETGQIKIIIPSEEYLKKYADMMNSKFDMMLNNSIENIALSELRDTLLPRLMSGELAITDVDDRSIFQ